MLRKPHCHPPGSVAQAWLSPKLDQSDTASHHGAAPSDKHLHQGGRSQSARRATGEQGLISDKGGAGTLQTALPHAHQAAHCAQGNCALQGDLKAAVRCAEVAIATNRLNPAHQLTGRTPLPTGTA